MSGGCVLVTDDSPTVRAVMASMLRAEGYDVLEAPGGEEAIETMRSRAPGVVLLDVEMPGIDGFEVLARVREDVQLARIPVIFVTGRDNPEDVARGLREGAHDYLRKPAERTELLARVHAALRTRALEDELRRRNEELDRIASTDHLTGLLNRRVVSGEIKRMVSLARRHDRPFCLALLDIDHFKSINDTLGHDVGDAVLIGLAERVSSRLRDHDVFGRWGGEEFLLLLPETAAEGAVALADAVRTVISEPAMVVDGQDVRVTVSVGVATWAGDDAEALLRRADAALYAAKDAGRDTVRTAPT